MYYSHTYNTLWHDTDPRGLLRPSAYLRYMQETGNRQCRDFGYDLDTMFRRDRMGFILARLRLRVIRPLRAYEDIEVRTWCPPSRGVTFLRCFSILRGGETFAEAMSYWALVDADSRRFIRVGDFDRPFPDGEPLPEEALPPMARVPSALVFQTVGQRPVTPADLDFNLHMNNTRYPDVICDALPDDALSGRYVSGLSISYIKEAPGGSVLSVGRLPDPAAPGSWMVRGTLGSGETCFDALAGLAEIPTDGD